MSHDEHGTHDEPDPSVSGPEDQSVRQHARRRLLKAAGMAPVIYTLPSGGALAGTSSSCLGDSKNVITVSKETKEVCNLGNSSVTASRKAQVCANTGYEIEETGNLTDGIRTFEPTDEHRDGGVRVYAHGEERFVLHDDQTLVAGSCWGSISLSSTKTFDRLL